MAFRSYYSRRSYYPRRPAYGGYRRYGSRFGARSLSGRHRY